MTTLERDLAAFAAGPAGELDRRRVVVARVAVLVGILATWQLVVAFGLVDAFWISTPVLIVEELWHLVETGSLVGDVAVTVYEAVIAFIVSSALGVICGL